MNELNLDAIKPVLVANDVEFAALFGSFARSEQRPDSDVDLLIRLKKPKSFFELGRLEDQLSQKLSRKIDLVTEKSLSRHIKPYVMKDLHVIYEGWSHVPRAYSRGH